MKLLGILLICLTGMGCGVAAYMSLARRVSALDLLVRFSEQMAEQMRYTTAPLEELIKDLAKREEFAKEPLFSGWRAGDPRQALCTACRTEGDAWGLSSEDRRLFEEFVSQLGMSDLEGEITRCRRYARLFSERCTAAREELRHKGRLYITLGCCGGSALALVMG